jgi:hypothetical protein
MMLYDLFSWISNSRNLDLLKPHLIDIPSFEYEKKLALKCRRELLFELREKKFSQLDSKNVIDRLDSHNAYCRFMTFCHPLLIERKEMSSFFLALGYLLSGSPDEDEVVDLPNKIQSIFMILLRDEKEETLAFFKAHEDKLGHFENIVRAVDVQKSVDSTIDHLTRLSMALRHQENPMALVSIFKKSIADTELFAAEILWLLKREVSVERILQTNLLQNFMSYHLAYLDSFESPVKYLYRLLEQFESARELLVEAERVPCDERGFHSEQEGALSYSIRGVLRNQTELQCVDILSSSLSFSPCEENFKALYHLFDVSFLHMAVVGYAEEENETWRTILSDFFSQNLDAISTIVRSSVSMGPAFLEVLSTLIDDVTAEKLFYQHNGAALCLLPFKPNLCSKIENYDIRSYVVKVITDLPVYDAIPALIALFSVVRGVNKPVSMLVYEAILNLVLLEPQCIEDSDLLKKLKKFAHTKGIIDKKNQELQEQFEQCIFEQVSDGPFSTFNYYAIEDTWKKVLRQLGVLSEIMSITNSCPQDKYKLQAYVGKEIFLKDPVRFQLVDFFSALEVCPLLSDQEVNQFERLLIEMITAIDHELIRTPIISIFEANDVKREPWRLKEYGGQCVFERAIQSNNMGLVQWLESKKVPFNTEQAITLASKSGHWDMARHFADMLITDRVHKRVFNHIFLLSATAGQLDMVRFLCETIQIRWSRDSINPVFMAAVENNRFDVVRYLYENTTTIPCETMRLKAFKKATKLGHLDLIGFMGDFRYDNHLSREVSNAFDRAVTQGSLPIIQRLCALENNSVSQGMIEKGFIRAIDKGQLPIARYLCDLESSRSPRPTTIDEALNRSISSWSLHKVDFIFSLLNHRPTQLAIEKVLGRLVKLNRLDFIAVLFNQKTPPRPPAVRDALCVAVRLGAAPMVKYLFDFANQEMIAQSFQWAAQYGQLDILKYCDRLNIQSQKATQFAIRQARKYHHDDVIPYLQTVLKRSSQRQLTHVAPLLINSGLRKSTSCSGLGSFRFFKPEENGIERHLSCSDQTVTFA